MWTILDRAGTSNTEERIALLRRYLAHFEAVSIRLLLADRVVSLEMVYEARREPSLAEAQAEAAGSAAGSMA
jgi:hypothetical protein